MWTCWMECALVLLVRVNSCEMILLKSKSPSFIKEFNIVLVPFGTLDCLPRVLRPRRSIFLLRHLDATGYDWCCFVTQIFVKSRFQLVQCSLRVRNTKEGFDGNEIAYIYAIRSTLCIIIPSGNTVKWMAGSQGSWWCVNQQWVLLDDII